MHLGGVVSAAVKAFLPSLCLHCGRGLSGEERGLCTACWSLILPATGSRCRQCGGPEDSGDDLCLSCQSAPPPQQGTVVWGEHDGVLRVALLAMKHGRHDELAAPLGSRLAARVAVEDWAGDIDAVTHVPSHFTHRLRRGWSAAALLAAVVASELGVPERKFLRRKGTTRQAERSRAQRLGLPRSALPSRRRVDGQRLLVVDDVTTTGTTLRRAADSLLSAGGKSVHCAALAWTPGPRRLT